MSTLSQNFSVEYRFDVHFTRDVFAPDNEVLLDALRAGQGRQTARCLVYLDEGLVRHRIDLPRAVMAWFALHEPAGVRLAASPEVVTGGEAGKQALSVVERVAETCTRLGICRHSYVLLVGGGGLLDSIGFAASLVHRGIRQIRLPTTTLAQCDAGLGVKNAVNALGQKNLLGTFTPPWAIVNDARFLELLDERSWRAGVAEAVKVGVIKDAAFVRDLAAAATALRHRDLGRMEWLVRRCAELHLDHITGSGDPFERGSSRPLDFGHWSAHRLELLTRHQLQHGEAVAIGVALDLLYAVELGRLTQDDADLALGTLQEVGFRLWDETLDLKDAHGRRAVLGGLEQFREHLGGELTLAMPDGLGARRDIASFDEALFEKALARLRRWRAPVAKGTGSLA